jgi:hypothetical protein
MEVKKERLGIQLIQALKLLSLCRAVELRLSQEFYGSKGQGDVQYARLAFYGLHLEKY